MWVYWSVNPTDGNPLRSAVNLLQSSLQDPAQTDNYSATPFHSKPDGLVNIVVHNRQVEEMSVGLF